MDEVGAIRARILGDAPTAALIDAYKADKAVFSPKKPPDYNYSPTPAVIIWPPTSLDDVSPFRGSRSQALVQVSVYALFPPNSTDDEAVDVLAKKIRGLFRGRGFVAADGLTYQALVSGPNAAPTASENTCGRLLQLRLNIGG